MKRNALTLIELVVILSIVGVLVAIFYGSFGAVFSGDSSKTDSFRAEVIRKFEYDHGGELGGTEFRVDVRRTKDGQIDTLKNQNAKTKLQVSR